jgi:hypothetical protein
MWLIILYLSEKRSPKVSEAAAIHTRRLRQPSANPELLSTPIVRLR